MYLSKQVEVNWDRFWAQYSVERRGVGGAAHVEVAISNMYLSKLQYVFVLIEKCSSPIKAEVN